MFQEMDDQFCDYIHQLRTEHQKERVYPFRYNGKSFWLKQPEILTGIWLLLKPRPKHAFIKERDRLLALRENTHYVPNIVYYEEDFFVLENAGTTINHLIQQDDIYEKEKALLLSQACFALMDLHRQGVFHGRPAIRDIAWNDGKITFLDFEAESHSHNKNWLMARDMLMFFYSICREESITNELIKETLVYCQVNVMQQEWQIMLYYAERFRWIYYLLLPFKSIAKTDLKAIYRLFELIFEET